MDYSFENSDSLSDNEEKENGILLNNISSEKYFTINNKIEEEVKEKCGIPNWESMIFGLFNQPLRKKLIETAKINPGYYNFILGVQKEFGIDCEKDLNQSLKFYKIAASYKDTYALHKLYNIYCYENEKFNVERDREKELFYLFQSISYSDASFFINNDTFFKIDISYEISLICELEENFYEKFKNMLNDVNNLEQDPDEINFIDSFISLKYLNEKHLMSFAKQLECVEKLKKLAEKNHLEACYKLAVVFRTSINLFLL